MEIEGNKAQIESINNRESIINNRENVVEWAHKRNGQ